MANTIKMKAPAGVFSYTTQRGTVVTPDLNTGLCDMDQQDVDNAITAGFTPARMIFLNVAGTGNGADTTEDVLATFSLPKNTLGSLARGIRVCAYFHCAANADNKTMRLYFGANSIATPTAATNNKNAYLELDVYFSSAGHQQVLGNGVVDVTPVTPTFVAGTDDETTALTIKATGQAGTGNANDIVCEAMTVELIP